MRVRKVISCLLVIAMLASMSTAFAATDSRGTTPVKLETEALDFSVTVPTSLPVSIAADGEVTVATDAKIVNNSAGSIEVKNVSVEAVTPWELTTWSDTDTLSTEKVNSKKFALSLQGTGVLSDGSCSAKFNSIVANGNLGLTYNAHVSPQSNALTGQQISNIVFTLGWDKATNNFAENEISSLSLDKGSLVMYVGTSETIHATAETKAQVAQLFSMRAAEDNGVTWSVDNENVSVENGKVTANSLGVSTVTASYEGLDAVCRVNVINAPVPLEAIGFTKNKVTLFKGESETVLLTYNPDKFTGAVDVSIVSNNDNVTVAPTSKVDVTGQDGPSAITLIGNKGGTSVVTATVVVDGKTLTSEIEVEVKEVPVKLESVNFDKDSLEITEGETGTVDLVFGPEDFNVPVDVTIIADNDNVTVEPFSLSGITSKDGSVAVKVTGNKTGNSVVTVIAMVDGKTLTAEVEVKTKSIYTDFVITKDNRAKVGYTGTEGENLVIPATFQDIDGTLYKVTSIGVMAFAGCESLASVTIPEGVTSIGMSAFRDCTKLTGVTIPKDITSISPSMFWGCTSLSNVVIPKDVTSIGNYAFRNCTNLTSVTIPDSVTNIGESVFQYCSSLTSVIIPNSVTNIKYGTFYGCTGLASVTIPESVTSIGELAFWHCTSLTKVTIPNGAISIGRQAFDGCTSLTNMTIPGSVTTIEDFAFQDCTSLTSMTIQDGVMGIGDDAFWGCYGLTNITIPNSVTSIGSSAFYGVPHITYHGTASGSPWGAKSIN